MRRADRLFLLINALQGRRTALPARRLAETLGVSVRTVYRDVADLQSSGVPIEGEAGVGYLLRKGADIPPLMFTPEELEALVVGVRFVRAFGGDRLAQSALLALVKIEAALPQGLRGRAERTRVFAPGRCWHEVGSGIIDRLHAAIATREVLVIDYRDEAGATSSRAIEPLCLAFWGGVWTVGAWCRMRTAFRNFRLDRIDALRPAGERFEDSPKHGLQAFLQEMKADVGRSARTGRKGTEIIKPI